MPYERIKGLCHDLLREQLRQARTASGAPTPARRRPNRARRRRRSWRICCSDIPARGTARRSRRSVRGRPTVGHHCGCRRRDGSAPCCCRSTSAAEPSPINPTPGQLRRRRRLRRYGGRPIHHQNGAGPLPTSDINTWVARRRRMLVTATAPICSYGNSSCSPTLASRSSVLTWSGRKEPLQPLRSPRSLVRSEAMPATRAPPERTRVAGPE